MGAREIVEFVQRCRVDRNGTTAIGGRLRASVVRGGLGFVYLHNICQDPDARDGVVFVVRHGLFVADVAFFDVRVVQFCLLTGVCGAAFHAIRCRASLQDIRVGLRLLARAIRRFGADLFADQRRLRFRFGDTIIVFGGYFWALLTVCYGVVRLFEVFPRILHFLCQYNARVGLFIFSHVRARLA